MKKVTTKTDALETTINDLVELTEEDAKLVAIDYSEMSDIELAEKIIAEKHFAINSAYSNELLTIAYWELDSRIDFNYYNLIGELN